MFFQHPKTKETGWATILMIPYGRGGAGFSVLDITKPNEPLHLYSIFNDEINHKVHHVDHEGTFADNWDYVSSTYNLINFREAKEATSCIQFFNFIFKTLNFKFFSLINIPLGNTICIN